MSPKENEKVGETGFCTKIKLIRAVYTEHLNSGEQSNVTELVVSPLVCCI